MTNTDGKVVKLESGAWAQYRQVAVQGLAATLLVAVELTEEEARKLLPAQAQAQPATVH